MPDRPLPTLLRSVSLAALVAIAGACGHAPTRGRDVSLANDAPVGSCERLGQVEGRAATGLLSFQEAANYAERDLRDVAARRGATHVHVTHRDEPGVSTVVYTGVAYRCSD